MRHLIDTNIAVFLRDSDPRVTHRIAELAAQPVLSVVSLVELEAGVYVDPTKTAMWRARLDLILNGLDVIPFTAAEATVYGQIVRRCGYSRRLVADRMIAATAIVADARFITANASDFTGIEGLQLESWTVD